MARGWLWGLVYFLSGCHLLLPLSSNDHDAGRELGTDSVAGSLDLDGQTQQDAQPWIDLWSDVCYVPTQTSCIDGIITFTASGPITCCTHDLSVSVSSPIDFASFKVCLGTAASFNCNSSPYQIDTPPGLWIWRFLLDVPCGVPGPFRFSFEGVPQVGGPLESYLCTLP